MNLIEDERGITVRKLDRCDVVAIAGLIEQLGYRRSAQDVLEWIDGAQAETQVALVACLKNEVVGWIEISIERRLQTARFALIGGLIVRDGKRGMGIGRRLCEEAELWSMQRGADKIRVTSRSTREDAHRFYRREGYELVKTSSVFEKKLGK